MPSFENPNGSFFPDYDVNTQVSVSAATITMAWNDRILFIDNATVYASLTVLLPTKVANGEVVEISSFNTITALTVKDGFGVAVPGAPNQITGGASAIQFRYINATVGWVPWAMSASDIPVQYLAMVNTSAAPIISATFAQAPEMVINMTGTLGAGAALTLPSAANFVPHLPRGFVIGATVKLRIINSGAGAFAWTVTTNSGWTLNGTMTVAQNTFRDFVITLGGTLASPTATLQTTGVGTFS